MIARDSLKSLHSDLYRARMLSAYLKPIPNTAAANATAMLVRPSTVMRLKPEAARR